MRRNLKILLDLDEVLVDFVGAALKVHGRTFAEIASNWKPGCWDMSVPMGLTPDQFWQPISKSGEQFWLALQPVKWFSNLITLVELYDSNWYIVTSPSKCITSYTGKVQWIKSRFGAEFDRFAITPDKILFARPDTVLIDDREDTIREFNNAGGLGILFPAYHNRLYRLRTDPMGYVKSMLSYYERS